MASVASVGRAVWDQRHVVAGAAPRLRQLMEAVGRKSDLSPYQWAQLFAFAVEFRPELIIELGRGYGNSTCVFLEAARHLAEGGSPCRVVSLCLTSAWHDETVGRVAPLCDAGWHARGKVLRGDILEYDFPAEIGAAKRVLVFWDAHGPEVADCVLSRVVPRIADRPHAILMHDISDAVYDQSNPSYADSHLWDGECATEHAFRVGRIQSSVTQAVLALDFTGRNGIALHTAAEDLHREFAADPERGRELEGLLGKDLFTLRGHWAWFSLNEATGPLTFPRPRPRPQPQLPPEPESAPVVPQRSLFARILRRVRRVVGTAKRRLVR